MKLNTNRLPGLVITEHIFDLPLDYSKPDGQKIKVFGREVVSPSRENEDLPWLVYLQGGPGFGSPRPFDSGGWMKAAPRRHLWLSAARPASWPSRVRGFAPG